MPDLSGVLLGGFSVVVLVLFLVQAIREAFPGIDSRFLPLVSLFIGCGLVSLSNFAPEAVVKTAATGIAVGAAASLSVRYVKNGDSGSSAVVTPPPSVFNAGSVEQAAASPVEPSPRMLQLLQERESFFVPPTPTAKPVKAAPVSVPSFQEAAWRGEANPRGDEPLVEEAQPRVTVTMPATK